MVYYSVTHGNYEGSSNICSETKRLGKVLLFYNCGFNRFTFGVLTYQLGALGNSQFMYDGPPNFDPTFQFNTTYAVVRTKEGPIDVIRWEHVREGVDDFKYIYTLEKYLEKVKDKNIKEINEAEIVLKDIKNITMKKGKAAWIETDFTAEALKNFLAVKLDYYRYKIAQNIIALKKLIK